MNKIFITVLAMSFGLALNAGTYNTTGTNIHAKMNAVRKYFRKKANADKPTISVYSNVKGPEPKAEVQQALPVLSVQPTVVSTAQAAETTVVNVYGGTVIVNN